MTEAIRAGRRTVPISSPDKKLFPRAGLTKLDLARYYADIAPAMVPHIREHPVAMQCYPGGIEAPGHYLKETPGHFPVWIARATLRKHGGTITHVLADDAPTLVYLAGQNCVTPHIWLSRADRPDVPDRMIFDLDPADSPFAEIRAAARDLGELLREGGASSWAMVSGSRGIHVVVPLRRDAGFEEVNAVARHVAGLLAAAHPRKLTVEHRKAKRAGRIFIDIYRNAYAQHAVPPYAVRAKPTAPVAMPLHWDELASRALRPDRWTIESAPRRLDSDGDAWAGIRRTAIGRAGLGRLAKL